LDDRLLLGLVPEQRLVDVFELGDVCALLHGVADVLDDFDQLPNRLVVLLLGVVALVALDLLILPDVDGLVVLDFEHPWDRHFVEDAVDLTEAGCERGLAVEELVDELVPRGAVAAIADIPAPEEVDLVDEVVLEEPHAGQ
jgi:hypothetical protein